jgi:hypothetical protein
MKEGDKKMKRFLFVLRVFKDDGISTGTMYRSYEAETLEKAREMLNKECGEKKRACVIKRTYIEI